MDLLAYLVAFAGAVLTSKGYGIGIPILVAPLVVLPLSLAKPRKPLLLLPLDFASSWVILPLGFLASASSDSALPLGFALHYYACIALVEHKARYVPWGAGLGLIWVTVLREEQPRRYWFWVGVFFTIAGLFLALGLGGVLLRLRVASG